jgi:GNAT superfamily N-acetyltransferase
VDILPLAHDGDVALLQGVVDLENAVSAVDSPWWHEETLENLVGAIRHGWDGEPAEHHVGVDGDRVVALGKVSTSEWDNLDLAWLELEVHPDLRRRGLGTQMWEHVTKRAAELGRSKIGSDAWDGTPGEPFANRHGLTRKSQSINRRQHVEELDLDAVRSLHAHAGEAAAAYELLRIEGFTPADLLPAMSEMVASINDAPLDDLDIEDEVFPPERIRTYEQAQLDRSYRLHRVVARHRDTGQLAGHTVVAVDSARPHLSYQHDTTVVQAHRGHRLGLLLKADMNLWLAETEPELRTVDTWNAESNDHMIAVNEILHYRWMGRGLELQP